MTVQRDVAVRYALEYSDKGLARAVQTTRTLEQTSQRTGQAVTAASRRMSDEWKLLDRQARQFDNDTTRRALSQGSAVSASVERQVVSMRKLGTSYREIAAVQRTAGTSAAETATAIERASAREIAAYKRVEAARGSLKRTLAKAVGVGSSTGGQEERSFVRGTVRGTVGRGASFLGGGLIGGVAGFVSAEGIRTAIEGTKELAKETQFLTQVTGMDTKTASEWIAVAESRGINAQALNVGFRTLSKGAEAALTGTTKAVAKTYDTLAAKTESALQGSKASIRAFQALGISQQDVARHQHDMAGLTQLVTDRLAGMRDGIEKTTLSNRLLGKSSSSTATAAKAFQELGITQQDLASHSHDLSGLLGLVADKLDRMHGGTRKTAIEAALLGRNAAALNPILSEGSKRMEEQRRQAAAYGVTLGGNAAENANKLREASENLKLAQIGLSVQFTEHVAPALIKVETGGIKLAVAIGHELTPAFKFLGPIVKDVGHWLSDNKTVVLALVGAFVGLKIIRTVGGWMGGLYNDGKRLVGAFGNLKTVATEGFGALSRQKSETAQLTVAMNELAASVERVAVAEKGLAAGARMPPIAGGALTAAERAPFGTGGMPAGLISAGKTGTGGAPGEGLIMGSTRPGSIAAAEKVVTAETSRMQRLSGALGGALGGAARGLAGFGLATAGIAGLINAVTGKGGQGGVAGFAQKFLSGASFGVLKTPTGPQAQIEKQIATATAEQLPALRALVKKTLELGGLSTKQAAVERQLIDARGRQLKTIGVSTVPGTMRLLASDQGASRFSTVGAQLHAITPKLTDLGKVGQQYQNAGALAALKFALGLEQNRRLPKGSTDRLIRDLESKFPALAKFMGRAGITSVTALSDALDARRIETSAKKLVDGFRRQFVWMPKFAQTAGDSTQQKMRTAEAALRHIIATGSAEQRAAAQPMLKKLVADYAAYMDAIKQKTADAEKEARASIEQLGGDWQNLGSVVQTVVNQMILPSAQAAGGAITSTLNLSGQLAQVTHSLRGHQAVSVPTGIRLTHGSPRRPVTGAPRVSAGAHHAARHSGAVWSAGGGGGGGERATMRYYHHHPIGKMTEAQYQAYLAAHAPGPSAGRVRRPVFHTPVAETRLLDQAATQQQALALAQKRLDDRMTRRGIDQASAQGARLLEAFDIHSVHVLKRTVRELRHAYEIAKKTGNRQDIMSAGSKLQQALGQLDQAVTDKIVQHRNRIEAVAQALVDKATHREALATAGEQALQLRQQLAGTYGTVGGAQQLSAYIKSQVVPALTGELTALRKQEKAAKKAGDKALADQIAESIANKQGDILQAQLDAQNAIKDAAQQTAQNTATSAQGDLGVSYQGQAMGDLAGLFNGV